MVSYEGAAYEEALSRISDHALRRSDPQALRDLQHVLAVPGAIANARRRLPSRLPDRGLGLAETIEVLHRDVAPALAQGHNGPRYFSFVTGGTLPAAALADHLATTYDNSPQVNLPDDSISTWIESLALDYVLDLLDLPSEAFAARTITTGATASNVLGLACGREMVVKNFVDPDGIKDWSVAEDGFGLIDVCVFTAGAHVSIAKAASIVGIGRSNVKERVLPGDESAVAFDLVRLDAELAARRRSYRGSIVVANMGEVNNGAMTRDIPALRTMCDEHGAWLHVDAAFGAFALLHPDFAALRSHLAMADSICLDAHKWLNVPYDTGLFYARHQHALTEVFGPGARGGPAYLGSTGGADQSDPLAAMAASSPSPLHCGIENRQGYIELVGRNIAFARAIDDHVRTRPDWVALIPDPSHIINIVLFKPKDVDAHEVASRINTAGRIYVGRTVWNGQKAIRMAISNWMTTVEDDLQVTLDALDTALRDVQRSHADQ